LLHKLRILENISLVFKTPTLKTLHLSRFLRESQFCVIQHLSLDLNIPLYATNNARRGFAESKAEMLRSIKHSKQMEKCTRNNYVACPARLKITPEQTAFLKRANTKWPAVAQLSIGGLGLWVINCQCNEPALSTLCAPFQSRVQAEVPTSRLAPWSDKLQARSSASHKFNILSQRVIKRKIKSSPSAAINLVMPSVLYLIKFVWAEKATLLIRRNIFLGRREDLLRNIYCVTPS